MGEKEFLEKYGDELVGMDSSHKGTFYFSNERVSVSGTAYYRGELYPAMKVSEFFKEVEYFDFTIK